jgi:transposase InsO family protein
VAESFFATYKKEPIHTKLWSAIASLKKDTFTRVEEYYNRTRRHSSLEYLTPADYRLGYSHIHELAA